MSRLIRVIGVLLAVLALTITGANAAGPHHALVKGHFTKADDNPTLPSLPIGTTTLHQVGSNGPITGTVRIHGLTPGATYVTVPYKDGVCSFTPGVSAFPSSAFTTDAKGDYSGSVTVNPAAVNPLGTLSLLDVHSVSIRNVLATLPVGPPTLPSPDPETCDGAPVVR